MTSDFEIIKDDNSQHGYFLIYDYSTIKISIWLHDYDLIDLHNEIAEMFELDKRGNGR